jgi:hypothetical protein
MYLASENDEFHETENYSRSSSCKNMFSFFSIKGDKCFCPTNYQVLKNVVAY